MPVQLALNDEQMSVFQTAIKGKNIVQSNNGRIIQITRENHQPIRDAIEALHIKKYSVKTKTSEHLATCYHCQEILKRLDSMAAEFANDNKLGIIVEGPESVEANSDESASLDDARSAIVDALSKAGSDDGSE